MDFVALLPRLAVFVAGIGLWYVALNKRARRCATLSLRGVGKRNKEDVETVGALVLGLGIVFGLFLNIVGLFSLIEFFTE